MDLTHNNIDKAILSNFEIIDFSNILQITNHVLHRNFDYFSNISKQIKLETGIMIGYFVISEKNELFLLIFDDLIFIFEPKELPLFQKFFTENQNKTPIYFLNENCHQKFEDIMTKKIPAFENKDQKLFLANLSKRIVNQIIMCIIKKSQIRTQERYNKSKKNFQKIDFSFGIQNFIKIKNFGGSTSLYFNTNDQLLYVLKYFDVCDDESIRQFEHELNFYEAINNKNPFLPKFYGTIRTKALNYIIIEYIEGQMLSSYINNPENINDKQDLFRNILEIIISIEFIHLKDFILRDLKPDNIIIDSNKHSILIDFDRSRQDEEVITGNLGNPSYAALELLNKNEFSKKSDIFSLGKIIHFILSKFEKCSNNFEYDKLVDIYQKCIKELPEERPNIETIVDDIFLSNPIHESNNEIVTIIDQLFIYRVQLIENLLKLSDEYLETKLKSIFFIDKDVNLSIHYLTLLSEKVGDSFAQSFLGSIYFNGKSNIPQDIEKGLHYLILSADQKNSMALYILGQAYFEGRNVTQDIQKSLYYLTL